jgi:hypothetical protein
MSSNSGTGRTFITVLGLTQPHSTNTGVLVREFYHSTSSCAEIQNLWSSNSTLRPRPHGMDTDTFILYS